MLHGKLLTLFDFWQDVVIPLMSTHLTLVNRLNSAVKSCVTVKEASVTNPPAVVSVLMEPPTTAALVYPQMMSATAKMNLAL